MKIYCYKSFSEYFDLDLTPNNNEKNDIYEWSAHLVQVNKKPRLFLVNHITLFYFVIEVLENEKNNLNEIISKNLLNEISKSYKLNTEQFKLFNKKLEKISFYEKSKNSTLNSVVNQFIKMNKESLGSTTFKHFYSDEDILNDDSTEKFITDFLT